MKKIFAILGNPVSHSLSPKIHNAVFKTLGLKDREYVFCETRSEDFARVMKDFKEGFYEGFSVTAPYKEKVLKYCDDLSDRAWKVGAVNTVVKLRQPGKKGKEVIYGDNTDYVGFMKSLEEVGVEKGHGAQPKGRDSALVLGTGGVGRAVIAALIDMGFRVEVAALKPDSKQDLHDAFNVIIKGYDELDPDDDYAVIVNCTPVGMMCVPEGTKGQGPNVKVQKKVGVGVQNPKGQDGDVLLKDEKWYRAGRVYVDVIYSPRVTKFLEMAKNAGGKIVTGDRIFLWQAVEQAKYFCERDEVPLEVMEGVMRMDPCNKTLCPS